MKKIILYIIKNIELNLKYKNNIIEINIKYKNKQKTEQ